MPLARAVDVLLATKRTSWDDLRLVSDLARDAIARSELAFSRWRAYGRQDQVTASAATGERDVELESDLARVNAAAISALIYGLGRNTLTRLAPTTGDLVVVEFLQGENRRATIATVISRADVKTRLLDLPEVDYPSLRRRLQTRLANWLPSRAGDPLDLREWQQLKESFDEQLGSVVSPDAHVVVIDSQFTSGLPWHVRRGSGRTASYASSWTVLLDLAAGPDPAPPRVPGMAMVPRFREDPSVLRAFRSSWDRTEAFAAQWGMQLIKARDEQSDHDGLMRVLSQADAVKILCHGFVSPDDLEVALMLAHDGHLPLAHSVALASDIGKRHRFSWRDCMSVTNAPDVVFSAACSSGLTHIAGLGEGLGLFRGLRGAGTRAIVAPRWDINASIVLPILDDAYERHLSGSSSLAVCVDDANHAASTMCDGVPAWHAWALSVEGDWR